MVLLVENLGPNQGCEGHGGLLEVDLLPLVKDPHLEDRIATGTASTVASRLSTCSRTLLRPRYFVIARCHVHT